MTEPQNTPINQDSKDSKSMATPVKNSAVTKASKPDNTKPTAIKANETDEQERTLDTPSTPSTPHPVFIEVNERCLISAEQLKRYTNPDELPTDTRTAPDLDVGFGQQRALKALQTALHIHASGYHVFAAGENGLGKRTVISRLLQRIAADAPTPDDWVYVHNFTDPRTPQALRLPAGQGQILQQQVNQLWQQA
ncbi:MAG TPA: peptidase S16, partial [Psychrobacter sp.]|nr:peptidase S16 [Psychrobacter sp.]